MVLSSRELAAYTQHRKEAMKIVSFCPCIIPVNRNYGGGGVEGGRGEGDIL